MKSNGFGFFEKMGSIILFAIAAYVIVAIHQKSWLPLIGVAVVVIGSLLTHTIFGKFEGK